MPRRFRSTPWSRNGCSTCKRRRKKCDGQRPVCGACTRLGLACEQSDIFCQVDVVKPKETSPVIPPALPPMKLNTLQDMIPPELERWKEPKCAPNDRLLSPRSTGYALSQFIDDMFYQHASGPPNSPRLFNTQLYLEEVALPEEELYSPIASENCDVGSLPRPPDMFSPLASSDIQLLQYYTEKLSSCMSNTDGISNPLRVLIIPRMMASGLLFHAVSACAAQHQSLYMGTRKVEYEHLATSHYVRALSKLTEHIPSVFKSSAVWDMTDPWVDECVLLTSIFLCKYEIIKDGVAVWRRHLEGIEPLTERLVSKYPGSMRATLRFARSFITYHKCIASLTASGFDERVDQDLSSAHLYDDRDLNRIDLYMGCSQNLFPVLRRVMNLRFPGNKGLQTAEIEGEIEHILASLDLNRWGLQSFDIPKDMSPDTIANLRHVNQGFENCLMVCLHSALDDLSKENRIDAQDVSDLRQRIPLSKSEALDKCIQSTRAIPYNHPVEAGLLPLLFVIACETEVLETRFEMVMRVDNLADNFGIGNQRNASILMRQICLSKAGHDNGAWQNPRWNDLILT